MGKKLKIWIISIVIIGVSLNLGMYIYVKIAQHEAKVLYQQVKNNDKLYVYETYYKSLNAVMYVKDLADTAALIDFYVKTARHDKSAIINFEINTMPISNRQPIYVYRYLNKNSNILELIDFNKNCWGYIRGYVYKPTTHKDPPSEELIKDEDAFIAKYNSSKRAQTIKRITKTVTGYGWYCDD